MLMKDKILTESSPQSGFDTSKRYFVRGTLPSALRNAKLTNILQRLLFYLSCSKGTLGLLIYVAL